MTTYQDIVKQIAALQKEADALRQKETQAAIAEIREKIDLYGLTAADLGFKGDGAARSKPLAKYRDEAGNSWTGRGKKPGWLVAHLSAGRQIEEFLTR
ncbi:H-NS histone family protein [Ralstonia pseudosolanacearum]|uniref:H-NS histone family protein n=1 Tax=Ralstonia pseudosolanacearum TaxID=1310165 RepID=UPI00270DD4E5|nr:H-NS histone family protein [Ralstonia pseudosolanacearum]MDO3615329.1 H-NS histone family protein [Ralstonia pseudosolanacearum]